MCIFPKFLLTPEVIAIPAGILSHLRAKFGGRVDRPSMAGHNSRAALSSTDLKTWYIKSTK